MLRKLTITFTPEEREALDRLARAEFRPVKEQVRALVRAEAERRGLWPAAQEQGIPVEPGVPA
jgi:hypothetical protein